MWLIPGKTKIQTEIFKGVSFADILIGIVTGIIFACLLFSNLPNKFMISVVLFFITALLVARVGGEPNYVLLLHVLRHLGAPRRYERVITDQQLLEKSKSADPVTEMNVMEGDAETQHLPAETIPETKAEKKQRIKAEKAEKKLKDKAEKAERKQRIKAEKAERR
jgi:hypothetical protein